MLRAVDLSVSYSDLTGEVTAVRQISLELNSGETLGIVGESGCGKSSLALAIARLLPPNGSCEATRLEFQGRDLFALSDGEADRLRGEAISFVFQEPRSALDPLYRVGTQITEGLVLKRKVKRSEARALAIAALREVHIKDPERCADSYPHELSGGMLQRALLAAALISDPILLVADEPTTALDVATQAHVLRLLKKLRDRRQLSMLLVSHDLGVVAALADRILILYLGAVVEEGTTDQILGNPQHPYTRGLLESQPGLLKNGQPLPVVPGAVPSPRDLPKGCPFHPRCPEAEEQCRGDRRIPPVQVEEGHSVNCLRREPGNRP